MKCYSAFRVMNMSVSLCTTVACCAVFGASAHAIQTSIPAVGAFAHSAPGTSALSAEATPEELFNYGVNMYNAKNYEEAVKWWRLAAELGDARAQFNLGVCYDHGTGVARNFAEAVKWYRFAAEQGVVKAQYYLGLCYKYGVGVERDRQKAKEWLRKAAAQGDEDAKKALREGF